MKYQNIREEELKNKVGADWFAHFDTTEILGNIDFTVFPKQNQLFGRTPLLWAEAKTGDYDTATMFVQLILTIGKARTFDKTLPPAFLGAFDFKKIAFVPYISIQDIFYQNDFDWTVTPSNHQTKEFQLVKSRIEKILQEKTYTFDFEKDEKELKIFIKNNVAQASESAKIKIDKNNFIPIYLRWLEFVKPTIDVNWDELKKNGILDSDFYLADLFVDDKDTQKIEDDTAISDTLFVIYQNQGYKISKENSKQLFDAVINIKNRETYQGFWKRYKRPPIKEFQDYIVERRDLLVPQDIRERKGAFFTPRQWVELSQKYIADVLGENWQDEYYVWDCAAGTGNLLAGLTNKYNIWASTLDQADVNVMHDRIKHGANLLDSHVFQFDFLNDEFFPSATSSPSPRGLGGVENPSSRGIGGVSKLPQGLQDIINDPEKRKKLVIYINPPYAEASNKKTLKSGIEGNRGVEQSLVNKKYSKKLGQGNAELFAQFLTRIYFELPNVILTEFSKLKILSGQHFVSFREFFRAKLEKIFLTPADTFDNVKGKFPIGFFIWDTSINMAIEDTIADVYNKDGEFVGTKGVYIYDNSQYINDWIKPYRAKKDDKSIIGKFPFKGNDFQNQNMIIIVHQDMIYNKEAGQFLINPMNLIKASVYIAVRKCIEATWLNDRDQFLFPNEGWETDMEFQNDCLAYTLFSNNIQSQFGTNHWIPFTEQEVNAKDKFESHFMCDFINGKLKPEKETQLNAFAEPSSPSLRGLGGVLGGVKNASTEEKGKVTKALLEQHNIRTDNLLFSDMFLPYNPKLKEKSRALRQGYILAEALLWKELRADKFMGLSFNRQKPILNYIADFYCKELSVVIEIDGSSHDTEEAIIYDKERDRQMEVLGIKILRVRDEMVRKDMGNVLAEMKAFLTPLRDVLTPPDPLKEGEIRGTFLKEGEFSEERVFSNEAKAVFDAGRELWKYYHSFNAINVNASLYDIREFFQGRNEKGRMNSKSDDEKYMDLIGKLRENLKILAKKIEPKVYEYGFLKE